MESGSASGAAVACRGTAVIVCSPSVAAVQKSAGSSGSAAGRTAEGHAPSMSLDSSDWGLLCAARRCRLPGRIRQRVK